MTIVAVFCWVQLLLLSVRHADCHQYSQRDSKASNRLATQQSTWTTAVATYATDGDLTTFTCTGRPYNNNPWWQVDLGAVYPIDTVIIHPYYEERFPNRMSNFAVSLSNIPATIVPPVYQQYTSPCGQYPGSVAYGATVAMACPFTAPSARYVTIQTPNDALCMYEVEVYTRD
jgi:hypothetical protein